MLVACLSVARTPALTDDTTTIGSGLSHLHKKSYNQTPVHCKIAYPVHASNQKFELIQWQAFYIYANTALCRKHPSL